MLPSLRLILAFWRAFLTQRPSASLASTSSALSDFCDATSLLRFGDASQCVLWLCVGASLPLLQFAFVLQPNANAEWFLFPSASLGYPWWHLAGYKKDLKPALPQTHVFSRHRPSDWPCFAPCSTPFAPRSSIARSFKPASWSVWRACSDSHFLKRVVPLDYRKWRDLTAVWARPMNQLLLDHSKTAPLVNHSIALTSFLQALASLQSSGLHCH